MTMHSITTDYVAPPAPADTNVVPLSSGCGGFQTSIGTATQKYVAPLLTPTRDVKGEGVRFISSKARLQEKSKHDSVEVHLKGFGFTEALYFSGICI